MPAHVDITRELCPMTWVKVKLSLEPLPDGEVLEVLLKGDEPLRNVPQSAAEEGHRVLATEAAGDGNFRLTIQKRA
jgi:TusA-related sulfurtransferase